MTHPVSSSQKPQVSLCTQYALSVSLLSLGVIAALAGVFAYLAVHGRLPPNAGVLQKFEQVGLTNSYFLMGGGAVLTLLASSALLCVCKRQGELESA